MAVRAEWQQSVERRAPLASRLTETRDAYLFLLPGLIILLGFVAYPFLDGIATSLTDRGVARPGEFTGFANFSALFHDEIYALAVRNSIVLTVAAVALKFLLGMIAALLLAQKFPLRGLVRALVFLPWAVPGLIAALSWRWLYDELNGVLNFALLTLGLTEALVYWLSDPDVALFAIVVASVWHGLPFYIMMFLAGLAAIPTELYEAAAIDGANAWQRFVKVTLPGLRDVIAITLMLSSIWTFNSFHMVFILTNGGPANRTQILPTLAYEYGIRRSELGLGAAVMVSFVPVFLVLIFFLTRRMLRDRAAA
jgi:multiple sugar transport system permease protein